MFLSKVEEYYTIIKVRIVKIFSVNKLIFLYMYIVT